MATCIRLSCLSVHVNVLLFVIKSDDDLPVLDRQGVLLAIKVQVQIANERRGSSILIIVRVYNAKNFMILQFSDWSETALHSSRSRESRKHERK